MLLVLKVVEAVDFSLNMLSCTECLCVVGLVVFGLRTGQVKALITEVDSDKEAVEVHEQCLWTDQDQLTPKVFHWLEEVRSPKPQPSQ